jgi:RNA polymerase sigma factor (sigma-70 family)
VIAPGPGIGETRDDTSLGDRIREGDRTAENELVTFYSSRVFAVAVVRVHDRQAALELVDDALMATVTALRTGSVRDVSHLGAFIHGTALNVIHNYLRDRSRSRRTESVHDEPTTPDLAVACERDSDLQQLRGFVARLRPGDGLVLSMTLLEGLTPGEIAARLGLSVAVVRQRKSRALKRLKVLLIAH